MALAFESASLVQRKAYTFAKGPYCNKALDGFFKWWAANKENADLELVPYLGTDIEGASGSDLAKDGEFRVYAFYGKKTATAEDVYVYFFDDASNDAGGGTDGRGQLVFLEASTEALVVYPSGIPMTTGLVVKAYTDFDGTTDTTAGAAPNGFVLIGRP
jgi:hypothetical protein